MKDKISKSIVFSKDQLYTDQKLVFSYKGKVYSKRHDHVLITYSYYQALKRAISPNYKGDFMATESWIRKGSFSFTCQQNQGFMDSLIDMI